MKPTLLVNLYAGPGAGKSTLAAWTFAMLKQAGHNAELVTEFAKDITWEHTPGTRTDTRLEFQPLIMGEQMWRMERLRGKVDVIVTDSPVLLSMVYAPPMPPAWDDWIRHYERSWDTLTVRVDRRERPYNPAGRNQSERQAKALDEQIIGLLHDEVIATPTVIAADHNGVNTLVRHIQRRLRPRQPHTVMEAR